MTTLQPPSASSQVNALDDAWTHVQSAIERASSRISQACDGALDRAEAYRQLLRFIGHAHDYCIEHADPARPTLYNFETPQRKIWGDNPDAMYHLARIDGQHSYRLTGVRGSANYIGFQLYRRASAGLQDRVAGVLSGDDIQVNPDGTFEIHLSRDPQPENWLQLDDHTNELIIREYFLDRNAAIPASLKIEVTAGSRPSPVMAPEIAQRKLMQVARLIDTGVERTVQLWEKLSAHPNVFSHDEALTSNLSGTTDNVYHMAAYRLKEDDALEIDFMPPAAAAYWGIQVCNPWFESLEYRDCQVSLNMSQCVLEKDGSVRILLSARASPGANWLDTAGHQQGLLLLRFLRATSAPLPKTRILRANIS